MSYRFSFIGETFVGDALVSMLEDLGHKFVEAPQEADCILTYHLFPTETEALYFGEAGLYQRLKPKAYLLDLSANLPQFNREAHDFAAVQDFVALDAPLLFASDALVGESELLAGAKLAVGGSPEEFAFVEDLFKGSSVTCVHAGELGAGELLKLSATYSVCAGMVALAEAAGLNYSYLLAQAQKQARDDLALERCKHLLEKSCNELESLGLVSRACVKLVRSFLVQDSCPGMAGRIILGDMFCAVEAAKDLDLNLPGAEATLRLLEMFVIVSGGSHSLAALPYLYLDDKHSKHLKFDWERLNQLMGFDEQDRDKGLEYSEDEEAI